MYITKSKRKNKKYDLLDSDKKYILSFGDSRYQDYTMHKDDDRKTIIYPGTEKKIIVLKTLNQRLLCLLICYGVNQHYRHQLVMSIKDLILMLNLFRNMYTLIIKNTFST